MYDLRRKIFAMATALALVVVLVFLSACAAETRQTKRDRQLQEEEEVAPRAAIGVLDTIRLSPGARRALHGYDPGFFVTGCRDAAYIEGVQPDEPDMPAGEASFSVEGDFNGDGAADLAVLGMTESHRALLALFCAGENCSVMEVERWPRTARGACETRLYLAPETPGTKRSPREARPLYLKHDAVRIYYDRAAQAILYFQNGAFNSYIMHD